MNLVCGVTSTCVYYMILSVDLVIVTIIIETTTINHYYHRSLIGMAACRAVRPVPITSVLGQGQRSPKRVVVSDRSSP